MYLATGSKLRRQVAFEFLPTAAACIDRERLTGKNLVNS